MADGVRAQSALVRVADHGFWSVPSQAEAEGRNYRVRLTSRGYCLSWQKKSTASTSLWSQNGSHSILFQHTPSREKL